MPACCTPRLLRMILPGPFRQHNPNPTMYVKDRQHLTDEGERKVNAILYEQSMLTGVGVPAGRIQAEGEEACQAPHFSLFRQGHDAPERVTVISTIVIKRCACYEFPAEFSTRFFDSFQKHLAPRTLRRILSPPRPPSLNIRSAQQSSSARASNIRRKEGNDHAHPLRRTTRYNGPDAS